MEPISKDDKNDVRQLLDFYIDLIENHRNTLKFYLSENVVLDWFGKTIKDSKNVSAFLKDKIGNITHHITDTSAAEQVAFRDVHHVKVPRLPRTVLEVTTPSEPICTPPNSQASTSHHLEMGQGDGPHNNRSCQLLSPPKRLKLSECSVDVTSGELMVEEGEESMEEENLKYLTAVCDVEFHRPSVKKLQTETKWRRPAKLHLGYVANGLKDCTIYLIIYEGNVKCRRNLLKEFCESESSKN